LLKLSASSMGSYDKCPRKYYYRYINKPDIVLPEWNHLEFGVAAHRALELFHEYLLENHVPKEKWNKLMSAAFKKSIDESKERNKFNNIKEDLDELKQVVQAYLNKVFIEGLPPVIHNELEFQFKIDEFTVRGFMDRIDKYDNGVYHVVDYKTSKNPNYLDDFQLALYALALKEKYEDVKSFRGSYVLLKHKSKYLDFDLSEKVLDKARNKVIKIGKDINTEEDWIKKPTKLCNWCDYKSICQDDWTDKGV